MNLAVVLEGLLMSTGRTKAVLVVGVIGSWCGQVPVSRAARQPRPYPPNS